MAISLKQAFRVGCAAFLVKFHRIDIIAAIARQGDAIALLDRRATRLTELSGNASNLHHGLPRAVSQHNGHLHHHAEHIAQIIGMELLKALRAVSALQQEGLAVGDIGQTRFKAAGFARENKRRITAQRILHFGELIQIRIILGDVLGWLCAPARGRPFRQIKYLKTSFACQSANLSKLGKLYHPENTAELAARGQRHNLFGEGWMHSAGAVKIGLG